MTLADDATLSQSAVGEASAVAETQRQIIFPRNIFEDLEHLRGQVLRNKRIVIFLDYDGTLSPIVERPDQAFMSESMRTALASLSNRFITAIVTGRSTDKVFQFVQLEELVYAGSHGFEIREGSNGIINKMISNSVNHCEDSSASGKGNSKSNNIMSCLIDVEYFRPLLQKSLQKFQSDFEHIPGIELEDNQLAISVHYRHIDQSRVNEVEKIIDDHLSLAEYKKLTKKIGKKVFELRPEVDWNKGRAVMWILNRLGLDLDDVIPFYLGDDVSDEDAFIALNERPMGKGISIIVRDDTKAKSSIDLPGTLKELPSTQALYSLKNPQEVEKFLLYLAGLMEVGNTRFNTNLLPPTSNALLH